MIAETQAQLQQWRLHMQRRWFNTTFAALAQLTTPMIAQQARAAGVDIIRNVAYGPHPVAHRLDIYRPRARPTPLPVLLYIHGGGFMICSKETHRGIALLKAARPGYLVFNINYRLAPRHRFPAAIEDACAAYRWVVANAARYGGDPSRIVVAGESAGGNLALGVAIAATYPRPEPYAREVYRCGVVPRAVMPVTPYLQVSDPEARSGGYWSRGVARDIARAYLGERGPRGPEALMADPIRILEECGKPRRPFPDVLSGVGSRDLCWEDVRRLQAACRRHGIKSCVRYYPGEVHAFHVLRWRHAARRFWKVMLDFMNRAADVAPRPARKAARRVTKVVERRVRKVVAPVPATARVVRTPASSRPRRAPQNQVRASNA